MRMLMQSILSAQFRFQRQKQEELFHVDAQVAVELIAQSLQRLVVDVFLGQVVVFVILIKLLSANDHVYERRLAVPGGA